MGSKKQINKSLIDNLQNGAPHMRECPLCNASYKENSADILFEDSGVHLVHITCGKCSSKILNIVTLSQIGMSSVGLFTDLSAEDTIRFYEKEPINEDDVLSFHHVVHAHSEEISNLFQ